MIDRLASAEEYDLLAISQVVGGLVFKKGDPEVLPAVSFKLLAAQTVEEARQILLGVDKSETKH